MGDEHIDVAQMLRDDARVERLGDRMFCLGPNVGRINFLSQQIRALNLVWALIRSKVIKPNDKVAVIGAGIAGVTAAFALRAHKCTVKIYDEGARPLHRQSGAIHRFVFPNINWWPHEEDELAITTALPFLDWYLGQCNHVIDVLSDEWLQLEKASKGELEFVGNTRIERAEPDQRNGGRLVLRSTTAELSDRFDSVIAALGFGEERPHLGLKTPSYWKPDSLEDVRDGKVRQLPAIISGFGDGGQIDALRLAYRFKFGEFSFTVASAIQVTTLKNEIVKAEQGKRTYEELAKEVAEEPDYAPIAQMLDDALHKERGAVIMVDNILNSPFKSAAAPIHKFLVAYAHEKETIDYRATELSKAKHVSKFAFGLGGQIYDLRKSHIVIRHGAFKPSHPMLIDPEEWKDLERAQARSRRFSYKRAWDEVKQPFAVPEGWPCRQRDKKRYIETHAERAQRAISNMGSSGLVVPAADGFIVYNHNRDFRPGTLFGMPVDYQPLEALRRKGGKAMA